MLVVVMPMVLLTYVLKPRLLNHVVRASLAAASHSILDLFAGYTPILWASERQLILG